MKTWQWVGVVWAAIVILVAVIRIAMAWVHELRKQAKQHELCEEHRCDYFTEYLEKGPPDLTHSQFHQAQQSLSYWEKAYEAWEEMGGSVPFHTSRMVQLFRMQTRA